MGNKRPAGAELVEAPRPRCFLASSQGIRRHIGREPDEVIGKIEAASHRADDRRQDAPHMD